MELAVDVILEKASSMAVSDGSGYLLAEHIICAFAGNNDFLNVARHCGAWADQALADAMNTVNAQERRPSSQAVPCITLEFGDVCTLTGQLVSKLHEVPSVKHLVMAMLMLDEDSHARWILSKAGFSLEKVNELKELDDRYLAPQYATCLSSEASKPDKPCMVGRDVELRKVVCALSSGESPLSIVVGKPGSGKTAFLYMLASVLERNKNVHPRLAGNVVHLVDIDALAANQAPQDGIQERINGLLSFATEAKHTILAIDGLHVLLQHCGGSAVQLLSSIAHACTAHKCKVVVTISDTEFKKLNALHSDFMSSASVTALSDLPLDQIKAVLESRLQDLAEWHSANAGMPVVDDVMRSVSSDAGSSGLPGRAIRLLDKRLAEASVNLEKTSDVSHAEHDGRHEVMFKTLAKRIKRDLYGQDNIVDMVVDRLKAACAGLRDNRKPKGVFAFFGESGSGKTELCRLLASNLGMHMVRIDMGEYSEPHSVAKLIGSPPGYVGFEQGGRLTEEVSSHPRSLILLDEMEKANGTVFNLLLPLLDEGILTDGQGKCVSFSECIVVMTGNIGCKAAAQLPGTGIGFIGSDKSSEIYDRELKAVFPPEFRGRIDAIVRFNPMTKEAMGLTFDKCLRQVNERLASRGVSVAVSRPLRRKLIADAMGERLGARPLLGIVERDIAAPLSDKILFGDLRDTSVGVSLADGRIVHQYNKENVRKRVKNERRKKDGR